MVFASGQTPTRTVRAIEEKMTMSKYATKQIVAFGTYGDETPKDQQVFVEGELVLLVENDDSGTEENPAFLAHAKDDSTKQAYVFSSELGDIQVDEKPAKAKGKGKSLKVRRKPSGGKDAAPKDTGKAAAKGKEASKDKASDGKSAKKAATSKAKAKATADSKKTAAKEKAAAVKEKSAAKAKAAKEATAKAKSVKDKAKAQALADKEAAEKVTHAPSIAKLVAKGGNAALKAAVEVADRIGSDFYTLGGLLFEIKEMSYYETLVGESGERLVGQPGFEEYIRTKLGVEYRMAQHYINVYVVTRRAGIAESKVKGLKCSKIVALLPLIKGGAISKENWDEWSEKAQTLKGDAFKEAVEKANVAAGVTSGASRGATANQTRFMFVLFDDRAKVAEKALELAKSQMPPREDGEDITNSEAFDHIMSEWATAAAQNG